jgi:hypothetical protein
MAQRAARRSRRLAPLPNRAGGSAAVAAVASVAACLIAVVGAVVLMTRTSPAESHAGHEHASVVYTAGGVELTVNRWQWMSHDMFGGPTPVQNNFPMPAQMMPGMQADDVNRLHVDLAITNGTRGPTRVSGQDFQLEASDGKQFKVNTPSNGSGGAVELDAGTSTSMDLYFDVPLKENVRYLVFTSAGDTVRVAYTGAAPPHQHGY